MNNISERVHSIPPSVALRDREQQRYRHPIGLEGTVQEIRKNPALEAVHLLPGTGFHVISEVAAFLRNQENGVSFEDSLNIIKQNVKGFSVEYLSQEPAFPIVLEKGVFEGKERILGGLDGKQLWVETVDRIERGGEVRSTVEGMEEFLLRAEIGLMVAYISPKGWSGYQMSSEGVLQSLNPTDIIYGRAKEIKFPDTQVFCVSILPNGKIRGFTLKSNLNLSQAEELKNKLTKEINEKENPELSENERIKKLVKNYIRFYPEDNKNIEDIARENKEVLGSEVAFVDDDGMPRTFTEMMNLLKNPEPLWTLTEKEEELMGIFGEYAKTKPDRRNLEIALGWVILQLMHSIKNPTKLDPGYNGVGTIYSQQANTSLNLAYDPRKSLEDLQQRAGCAGGGLRVDSFDGPRRGVFAPSDEYGPLEFTCPDCKRTNKRPRGVILSNCQYIDCMSSNVCAKPEPVVPNADRAKKPQS